jgi:hypothetical protein
MVTYRDYQYSTRLQDARPVRSGALRRLGAWLCLLAVLAQLGLPVVHIWDVSLEVATSVFQRVTLGAKDPITLRSPPVPSRRVSHDASMCAVCQAFAHARDSLALHGSEAFPTVACFALLLDTTSGGAAPDLTVSIPRAPPCSFS